MKLGDRVRLTEDGAEVAYRCDRGRGLNSGRVVEVGDGIDSGLVRIKRDEGFTPEVWAASFWEVAK